MKPVSAHLPRSVTSAILLAGVRDAKGALRIESRRRTATGLAAAIAPRPSALSCDCVRECTARRLGERQGLTLEAQKMPCSTKGLKQFC